MSNKFKIRNLENEKRRIDKQIEKLRREDETKPRGVEFIKFIEEERESKIIADNFERVLNTRYFYEFTREGNKITCKYSDAHSKIVGIGVSKCCEEDEFNLVTGCTIAERRAIADYFKQIELEEVKRYY